MKTENRYFFYFLTYQPSNVFLKFRPPKKHAKNWSFWRVEKWEKKSFGLEKSHEKIFFAHTFFKLLRALKGFIFDIFRFFFRLFVSVLGQKYINLGDFDIKIQQKLPQKLIFDMFPVPKHFSDGSRLFTGSKTSIVLKKTEIEIFSIFGHTNMYWSIWNFIDFGAKSLKKSVFWS